MLTEEQSADIEFCKKLVLSQINKIKEDSEKVKDKLISEVLLSIIFLKIFAAYLEEKKFENLEKAWRFLNDDIKGIIEKCFYVTHYLERINESMKANAK